MEKINLNLAKKAIDLFYGFYDGAALGSSVLFRVTKEGYFYDTSFASIEVFQDLEIEEILFLPIETLYKFVKDSKEELEVQIKENELVLFLGKQKLTLPKESFDLKTYQDRKSFLSKLEYNQSGFNTLNNSVFENALKVLPGKVESLPNFQCVYLMDGNLYATSQVRLYHAKVESSVNIALHSSLLKNLGSYILDVCEIGVHELYYVLQAPWFTLYSICPVEVNHAFGAKIQSVLSKFSDDWCLELTDEIKSFIKKYAAISSEGLVKQLRVEINEDIILTGRSNKSEMKFSTKNDDWNGLVVDVSFNLVYILPFVNQIKFLRGKQDHTLICFQTENEGIYLSPMTED